MLARLVALAAAAGASKIFGAAPGAPDSIMDDSSGTYCVGPVQEQLRQILVDNAARVIDLFRDWDDNGDGKVSKKDPHPEP